jgi:hypothetical protein
MKKSTSKLNVSDEQLSRWSKESPESIFNWLDSAIRFDYELNKKNPKRAKITKKLFNNE